MRSGGQVCLSMNLPQALGAQRLEVTMGEVLPQC